jgi:ribulose-phosphate 3-epimerase
MDGGFVPRLGLYPEFVREIRSISNLPIDIHMMMLDPEPYFEDFVAAGATRLVPHIEPITHVHRAMQKAHDLGAEFGFALNLHTDLTTLRYIARDLHSVTLMAINPGIVGHGFIEAAYDRITDAREFLDSANFAGSLEVDGGITFDNIPRVRACGANNLVIGAGTVYHPSASLAQNVERLTLLAA